jgi:hypothetical protein
MPAAHAGAAKKYAWMDHDPAYLDQAPPVQNIWYTVYHDYDVRQLLMSVLYRDDEETGADVEIMWTCDGNVYLMQKFLNDSEQFNVYKTKYDSTNEDALDEDVAGVGGNLGYRDKRALDFLVEVRVTSAIGTNAHLEARALYETLEVT